MTEFPVRTAVVCHDAGGANILLAALIQTGRKDWSAYMDGPGANLWRVAFPDVPLMNSCEEAISGADLLVTGTGWESCIEHSARKYAKSKGIKSVAIIDHWVNYRERFIRQGEYVLPDEFWVTDKYALKLVSTTFPGIAVFEFPNYYLENQLLLISQTEKINDFELLYILEPIRNNWGKSLPGEFQALNYFIKQLPKLNFPPSLRIRLRPHPSDFQGKYDEWIKDNPMLNIELDDSIQITESLGRAKWVAGCESFALVMALRAGRQVFCTLPPWAHTCQLPHEGFISIRNME